MIRHTIALSFIFVFFFTEIASAAEPFTPEQRAEIQKMIAAEREQIRQEVRAEILAELKQNKSGAIEADPGQPMNAQQAATAMPAMTRPALTDEITVVTAGRELSQGKSSIEFSAAAGDSDATIVIGDAFDTSTADKVTSRGWRLKLSSPINNKGKGSADFATLSGFSNGLSLDLALNYATTAKLDSGKAWRELCALSGQQNNDCKLDVIDEQAVNGGSTELRDAYQQYTKNYFKWGHIYELKIGAARNQYDYLDPALTEQSTTELGWTLGASMGFTTPKRRAMFAFGFDLERAYEEQDSNVYCPDSPSFPVQCVTGSLGAPDKDWNRLLWVEARSAAFDIPFSFRVTRELEDSVTGIDMPIYFLHDDDGLFTGGLRLGWTSENGFDAGIFVGKAFDVLE